MSEASYLTPAELLEQARALLERATSPLSGIWPRAAVLLARQALEAALDEFWMSKFLDMDTVSMRAQMACLPDYMDPEEAASLSEMWAVLTQACHYQSFDLGPTVGEVRSWIGDLKLPAADVRPPG